MTYFVVLLLWVLIFALKWNFSEHDKVSIKDLVVLLFPFYVIHAFVDGYSINDIPNYYDIFDDIKYLSISDILTGNLLLNIISVEKGWLLFTKAISLITSCKQVLLVVDSFVILYCYAYLIKKISYAPWLSVLILLCTIYPQSLFVLRQHTAIAICLLSIPYIIEQKLWKFLGIVELAILFHNTAACFLPLYFLYRFDINKKFYAIILIIGFVLYFLGVQFLSSALSYGLFTKNYLNYFEETERLNNYTGFLISFSELVFFVFFIRPNKKTIGFEKMLYIMMIVSTMFTALGGVIPIGGRLAKYYSIANIFAMPLCIKHANSKNRSVLCFLISLLYIVFALIQNQWAKPWLMNMKLIFEF